jgi:hypothetical protein
VEHPRRGPKEDAPGANLLAQAKLTEGRVVEGRYASITSPSRSNIELQQDRPSTKGPESTGGR